MPEADRTVPCPYAGCDGVASLAQEVDFDGPGAVLWSCPNGHRGPKLFRP